MDKWKFRDHATDPSKLKDIFRDVGKQKENDPRRKDCDAKRMKNSSKCVEKCK